MLRFISRKLLYGLLVLLGVVILVFFLFQGFGDPARLVLGQTGDSATIQNIRKELALDQPKWKQFVLYLNDVSSISFYSKEEIASRGIKGIFIGGENKIVIKFPYLRRSYQKRSFRNSLGSFAGHFNTCNNSNAYCDSSWNTTWSSCRSKAKYMDGYNSNFFKCARHFCSFIFYGNYSRICVWFCTERLHRLAHDGKFV